MPTEPNDAIVQFAGVCKSFRKEGASSLRELFSGLLIRRAPSFTALSDLTFSIARGETLGIIGRNGSGKSTILKLIAGVTTPTAGRVAVNGRVCPLIELAAGFHPDLSGYENVLLNAALLGLPGKETRELLADIVAFAELEEFMDMPVKRYSSGMYVRLGFAVAVHCRPDILLVDEALSVGDAQFQEKCLVRLEELKARGITIVAISHSQTLIESFCTRALLLDHGRLVFDGPPSDAFEQYGRLLNPYAVPA